MIKNREIGFIFGRWQGWIASLFLLFGQAAAAEFVEPLLDRDEAQAESEEVLKPLVQSFDQQLSLSYSYLRRFFDPSDARYLERHSLVLSQQKAIDVTGDLLTGLTFESYVWYQILNDEPYIQDRFYPSFVGVRGTLPSNNGYMQSLSQITARYYLPLDANERKYEEYIGGPALGYLYQYRFIDGFLRGISLRYEIEGTRSIRRYETNRGGNPLVKFELKQFVELRLPVPFIEGLQLAGNVLRLDTWDYDNVEFPTQYLFYYGLGYSLSEQISLRMGVYQGDELYNLGGRSNVRAWDENVSFYSFGISYSGLFGGHSADR